LPLKFENLKGLNYFGIFFTHILIIRHSNWLDFPFIGLGKAQNSWLNYSFPNLGIPKLVFTFPGLKGLENFGYYYL